MRAGTKTLDTAQTGDQPGSRAARVLGRVQELVSARRSYAYLEIGSFRGRSLLPHVLNNKCKRAVSVGQNADTSADDMTPELAKQCTATELAKLETITDSSDALRAGKPAQYDLAYIDGARTNVAVFRDFLNVLCVIRKDGVICFDETSLVLTGIRNALCVLEDRGIPHAMAFGRGEITIIALGDKAQSVIDALEADLTRPEDRVERSARRRTGETALRDARPNMMTDDKRVRRKAIQALKKDGWVVERATADTLVESENTPQKG